MSRDWHFIPISMTCGAPPYRSDAEDAGGDMLRIYNLPGRAIAELSYLWPKKGQVWQSGRRREHSFVHFCYSTVFYAVVYFFFVAGLSSQTPSYEPRASQTSSISTNSVQQESRSREDVPEETSPVDYGSDATATVVTVDAAAPFEEPMPIMTSSPIVQDLGFTSPEDVAPE